MIPTEFSKLLREDKELKEKWNLLSPSHKNEYLKWINQAKKAITKQARIKKTVEMIKSKESKKKLFLDM